MKRSSPINILIVDDSPGDVRLLREAMKEITLSYNLHTVSDGGLALEFLHRAGIYVDAVRPDLILLDFNMPKKNGREALMEIKSNERLRSIPVIVLTTSASEKDILLAYQLGANCYITKPSELDQFLKVIKSVADFWLETAKLPLGA